MKEHSFVFNKKDGFLYLHLKEDVDRESLLRLVDHKGPQVEMVGIEQVPPEQQQEIRDHMTQVRNAMCKAQPEWSRKPIIVGIELVEQVSRYTVRFKVGHMFLSEVEKIKAKILDISGLVRNADPTWDRM